MPDTATYEIRRLSDLLRTAEDEIAQLRREISRLRTGLPAPLTLPDEAEAGYTSLRAVAQRVSS